MKNYSRPMSICESQTRINRFSVENLLKMFDKYRCLIITLLSSVKKKLNAFKESASKLMRKEFDNFGNSQLKIFYLYQLGQLIININHS